MAFSSRRRPGRRFRRPLKRVIRRRSGWLHGLSTLLTVASQGERLSAAEAESPGDLSSNWRRLNQRLELGQRLLDPLPTALRASRWQETVLWKALRWGGLGMLLAWWLLR